MLEAYKRALEADPVSAFGGVIGINREVDGEAAEEIAKLFVEAIVAPGYTADALARFGAKKNLRLLEIAAGRDESGRVLKQISGGFLMQDADRHKLTDAELKVVTKRAPTAEEMRALRFAWTVCKHVKSNAIVYMRWSYAAKTGSPKAAATGMDTARRWGSARGSDEPGGCGAVRRDRIGGAAAGGDGGGVGRGFSPFPDGLETVAEAGATAVIQPGGSVRDGEVIEAADRLGVAMVFTGIRHFRHG